MSTTYGQEPCRANKKYRSVAGITDRQVEADDGLQPVVTDVEVDVFPMTCPLSSRLKLMNRSLVPAPKLYWSPAVNSMFRKVKEAPPEMCHRSQLEICRLSASSEGMDE